MRLLKQSSTAQVLMFLMIDSTDHVSPKTGLTPTVTISKNGAAFASPAGAVAEVGLGWYRVAGNATDNNTLGPLILHATSAGADPVDVEYGVVAFDSQSTTNLGLSNLDALISSRMATYVQPTGFLTATFPTGTVANTTNITAGTITTVTTVTGLTASNLDATVSSRLATASYVVPTNLTAAQIATGVWTDTVGTDFTTALSVGKSVMNGVTLGTGLTIVSVLGSVGSVSGSVSGSVASVVGAVGSVTGLTASNLDAAISSRMATYAQPTGFLAATFPNTVASPTNITAATGIVLSGVTHTGAVIPTVSVITGLTASNLDATISSRLSSASYTSPPSAATIAAAVDVALVNTGDGTDLLQAIANQIAADWVAGDASPIAVAAAVRTNLAVELARIDNTISSRMESYAQPTGFLTATFPTGTVANTTNITGGNITTVSGSVGSVTGLTVSNLDVAVSTRLSSASYVSPPSAASISAQVASDLSTAHGAGSWSTATGFSTLVQADIRIATGLASADLDTQLLQIRNYVLGQ